METQTIVSIVAARLERIDSNVDFIKSRIEKMEKDYDRLEERLGVKE